MSLNDPQMKAELPEIEQLEKASETDVDEYCGDVGTENGLRNNMPGEGDEA